MRAAPGWDPEAARQALDQTAALAATMSPWFLLLSGFVGAGLMVAGLTGFCGMAQLLVHMPWDRVLRG